MTVEDGQLLSKRCHKSMKASKTATTPKNGAGRVRAPEKGLKSPHSVRFAVAYEVELKCEDMKTAVMTVETLLDSDLQTLLNMDGSQVVKYKVMKDDCLTLSQNVDVRLKSGSTVNKVALKKSTSLNPPAKISDKALAKLFDWFDVAENMTWATDENLRWLGGYKQWYANYGCLSEKQLKNLKGTKKRIQCRDQTHGKQTYTKVYNEMIEEGKQVQARAYYKKHLKKYEKS